MTDAIDAIHFSQLAAINPQEVCRNALCGYDATDKCFTLSVWNLDYRVYPEEARIIREYDGRPVANIYVGLFAIHYLLTAKEIPVSNEWISEKDIPGGVTFFRGPHAIPTDLIGKRYQGDVSGFSEACRRLGGVPLEMADAAYHFKIAPRIPIAVLFWDADDEFPAESKVLFDRTIIDHLALDIVFALAVEVCTRIAGR